MERRATLRFRMKSQMRIRWATESRNWEAQTESEDIASRGAYFFLPTEIENGSLVELVLVLPHEITSTGSLLIRCQARVRRTEIKRWNRIGIAAEIEIARFWVKARASRPRLGQLDLVRRFDRGGDILEQSITNS